LRSLLADHDLDECFDDVWSDSQLLFVQQLQVQAHAPLRPSSELAVEVGELWGAGQVLDNAQLDQAGRHILRCLPHICVDQAQLRPHLCRVKLGHLTGKKGYQAHSL
jgi:hypothetical protein